MHMVTKRDKISHASYTINYRSLQSMKPIQLFRYLKVKKKKHSKYIKRIHACMHANDFLVYHRYRSRISLQNLTCYLFLKMYLYLLSDWRSQGLKSPIFEKLLISCKIEKTTELK